MSALELGLIFMVAAAATTLGGNRFAADAGGTARSADGVPIVFQVSGKGEPTVVLVHGWALDHRVWEGQVAPLAARRRVVTLDLAGHGESGRDRSAWTMAAFGEDVKAVVEAVGAKQVVLVGHSMGGPVVLEAARRMPERVKGIVLVDTLPDVEKRTPPDAIEAMTRQLQGDYKAVITQFTNEYLFAPGTPATVRERVLGHATGMTPGISIAMLRQAWGYDPVPALREIKAPVRAVNTDKYPTNLDVSRRYMPGFEVALIPGSGHYPMLEDPARFDPALEQAIGQVLAAPR